jgi:hypothetical protein
MTEQAAARPPNGAAPSSTSREGVVERIRGYLPWIGGAIVIVALLGALKWWGEQQQRAALHGRAWPPEPIKVFLRG